MAKTSNIKFAELRQFLISLGFAAKRVESTSPPAWVFKHRTEGLVVFRLYGEEDDVFERDLVTTRRFLDMRGLLEAADFDSFVQKASAPA